MELNTEDVSGRPTPGSNGGQLPLDTSLLTTNEPFFMKLMDTK
jgi:hypothetical protein